MPGMIREIVGRAASSAIRSPRAIALLVIALAFEGNALAQDEPITDTVTTRPRPEYDARGARAELLAGQAVFHILL